MVHTVRTGEGEVSSAAHHVWGVLRELKLRLHAAITDEVKGSRYKTMSWMMEGPTPQNRAWNYFRWNPELKQQEVVPPEKQAQRPHQEVMEQLELLEKHCVEGNNLTRFASHA